MAAYLDEDGQGLRQSEVEHQAKETTVCIPERTLDQRAERSQLAVAILMAKGGCLRCKDDDDGGYDTADDGQQPDLSMVSIVVRQALV